MPVPPNTTDAHSQPCLAPPPVQERTDESAVEDPNVVLPPGLRETQLTDEAARQLRQLLDDPNQPAHEGKEMPTADASALRKKGC